MTWTSEQLGKIPEVYRDFMRTLRPVVTSRTPGALLRFAGIHFGTVYDALAEDYHYDQEKVREVAENLKRAGLIHEDSRGFFSPTPQGEEFLSALESNGLPTVTSVPPFPSV